MIRVCLSLLAAGCPFLPRPLRVSTPEEARTSWPVLMEGDGGKDVHALHVVLQQVRAPPAVLLLRLLLICTALGCVCA